MLKTLSQNKLFVNTFCSRLQFISVKKCKKVAKKSFNIKMLRCSFLFFISFPYLFLISRFNFVRFLYLKCKNSLFFKDFLLICNNYIYFVNTSIFKTLTYILNPKRPSKSIHFPVILWVPDYYVLTSNVMYFFLKIAFEIRHIPL